MIMKELHDRIVRQKTFIAEVSVIGEVWRIPQYSNREEIIHVKRANKYLDRQWRRLVKLIKARNIPGSFRVFKFLVKDSISFRVFWFNKVARGWYHNMSQRRLKGLMSLLDRTIVTWDPNLNSVRKYIPKSNGKVRPLGVPALHFRIITAMWANYLQLIINPTLDNSQHGFRHKRSVVTAIRDVWKNSKEHPVMFEFDLTAFFNKVEMKAVYASLKKLGLPISFVNYVNWINSTPPKIFRDELDPTDEEVKKTVTEFEGGINKETEHLNKIGLPQGLPWSPILAINVLDKYLVHRYPNITFTLFADDGIMFADNKEDIERVLSDPALKMIGIVFSNKLKKDGTPSSKFIETDTVEFVGCNLNLRSGMVTSEKGTIHIDDKNLSKVIWNGYTEKKEFKDWKEIPNSYLIQYLNTYDLGEWLWSWWEYLKDILLWFLGYKNQRSMRIYGLFSPYHISRMSSFCSNMLLDKMKKNFFRDDNLVRRKKRTPAFEFLYRYEDTGTPLHFFNLLRWIKDEELLDIKSAYRDSLNRRFDLMHLIYIDAERTKLKYTSQIPFEIVWFGHKREKMLRRYWAHNDFNALR